MSANASVPGVPADLAALVKLAKARKVRYVFFETLVSAKLAETLAREIGAQTLVLNPVEGLTKEEEEGYYYGFSNEGLWPLCHVVHARPLFRSEDWEQYRIVNGKFATTLLEEMEGHEAPMVLIQDYHLALLPALIKARRPDARVAIFWHIPWPNFEAFGICPWQREILVGMLGADIIGFHTQYHCNNFLESVDRTLEARIDGETVIVSSPEVSKPVAVRYAWADNPVCNLCNKAGLPASPFRTDTWPGVTADKK